MWKITGRVSSRELGFKSKKSDFRSRNLLLTLYYNLCTPIVISVRIDIFIGFYLTSELEMLNSELDESELYRESQLF